MLLSTYAGQDPEQGYSDSPAVWRIEIGLNMHSQKKKVGNRNVTKYQYIIQNKEIMCSIQIHILIGIGHFGETRGAHWDWDLMGTKKKWKQICISWDNKKKTHTDLNDAFSIHSFILSNCLVRNAVV